MPSSTKRVLILAVATLAIAGGVLTFVGWYIALAQPEKVDWLEILYRTYLAYKLDRPGGDYSSANFFLKLGLVIAPLATLSAVLGVVLEFLGSRIEGWRASRQKDHYIVCGLGERGKAFVDSLVAGGHAVVAIDSAGNDALAAFCRRHKVPFVAGDCRNAKVLHSAAVEKAKGAVIVTDDDNANLEAALAIRSICKDHQRSTARKVFVSVRDAELWRKLSSSDGVKRRENGTDLIPFSLPALAARKFFWDHPLYTVADLRGQRLIHLVVVGFDDYAINVAAQLMRVGIYKDFAAPRMTVLVPDAAHDEQRFRRIHPDIDVAYPGLGRLGTVRFLEFDTAINSLTDKVMADIEGEHAVTAVIVTADSSSATLQHALRVRDAMQINGRWKAPVYIRAGSLSGDLGIICRDDLTPYFSSIIAPFGTVAELCTLDLLEGPLEGIAKNIHDSYQAARSAEFKSTVSQERAESAQSWDDLPETYRQANRRAADHIKPKLASLDWYVPPGFSLKAAAAAHIRDFKTAMEQLARLEHKSWCADRRIDGWRWLPGAKRNNERRIHDNLVGFDKLDKTAQDYDFQQIELLDDKILDRRDDTTSDRNVIRRDIWIGLIGHNAIRLKEAERIAYCVATDVLSKICARFPNACYTLVSPLAPGSDYVMTQAALDYLEREKKMHRLLGVEGVPESFMLDDYEPHFKEGYSWDGGASAAGALWSSEQSSSKTVRREISASRWNTWTNQKKAVQRLSGWVIDLTDPNLNYDDNKNRQSGYAKAADYIARRATYLIAACRSGGPRLTGGTSDTLVLRQDLCENGTLGSWAGEREAVTIQIDPSSGQAVTLSSRGWADMENPPGL